MRLNGGTRSLLAGMAIAAAALADGNAAELPNMRAPPPKHAKACRVGGMEGHYLAGGNVCVRVSGYISAGAAIGKLSK